MMYCFQAGLPAAQARAWFESEFPRSRETAREQPLQAPARVEPASVIEPPPNGFCLPSNFSHYGLVLPRNSKTEGPYSAVQATNCKI
eukprot:8721522-Karenia_brevis.AAC.1